MWFYVDKDRQQQGPVAVDELKRLLALGTINRRTHLWQEGRANWVRLEDLAAELGIALQAAPPPTPAATMILQPLAQPPASAQPAPAPRMAQPGPQMQAPPPHAPLAQAPMPAQMQAPMPPAMQAQQPYPQPQAYAPAVQNMPPPQAGPGPFMPPSAPMGYPQQQGGFPMPQQVQKSGGANWLVILGALGAAAVLGYKYFGDKIPAIAEYEAKSAITGAIDALKPAMEESAVIQKEKSECPGESNPMKTEISFGDSDKADWYYGQTEANLCWVKWVFQKEHKLQVLAEKTIVMVHDQNKWHCVSDIDVKLLPTGCEKMQ
jgi:hypothetical protein